MVFDCSEISDVFHVLFFFFFLLLLKGGVKLKSNFSESALHSTLIYLAKLQMYVMFSFSKF